MKPRPFTPEEDAVILALSTREAARKLERGARTIRGRRELLRQRGEIPVTWDDGTPVEMRQTVSLPKLHAEGADRFAELTRVTAKGPIAFEALCDALNLPPKAARELIAEAAKHSIRVDLVGGQVVQPPLEPIQDRQAVSVQSAGDWSIIAAVGDIHFGNKHHMGAQLNDFFRTAYARGVRQFLHVGDLLDGNYRHSLYEQTARGFEEQAALAIANLPAAQGATWHWIQGNHDETLGEQSGVDIGKALTAAFHEAGRHDLIYHGARGAYLQLMSGNHRGLFAELWHPRSSAGNSVYGVTYPLIRKVERYAPGTKPDLLLAGHWHQSAYVERRGVHAFAAGCWQGGQSSFGKSIGGSPDIASWIIEYALTEGGTLRCLRPERIGYQEVETAREVRLG